MERLSLRQLKIEEGTVLTVADARELMGPDGDGMTDADLADMLESMYALAHDALDIAKASSRMAPDVLPLNVNAAGSTPAGAAL